MNKFEDVFLPKNGKYVNYPNTHYFERVFLWHKNSQGFVKSLRFLFSLMRLKNIEYSTGHFYRYFNIPLQEPTGNSSSKEVQYFLWTKQGIIFFFFSKIAQSSVGVGGGGGFISPSGFYLPFQEQSTDSA